MRSSISTALAKAGRAYEAGIVTQGGSKLTVLPAPFLRTWKVVQIDYRQGARPVLFHVATQGPYAYLLTGLPSEFGKMNTADGVRISDPATAAEVGRLYLETTRPAGKLSYVINSVDEIKFRPGISGTDVQHRDEILSKYRTVVSAPAATAKGGEYSVVAYVVKDRELQRRDLTITAAGDVKEAVKVLVPDLPVPYTL